MADRNLKIALKTIGADRWIAGIYYISNLVRSLKSLPESESPRIVLARSAESEVAHHQNLDGVVEWFPRNHVRETTSLRAKVRRRATRIVDGNASLFKLSRWVFSHTKKLRYRRLLNELSNERVSILFPCLASVGKKTPIPWLPWAWDFQHKYHPDLFSKGEKTNRDRIFKSFIDDAPLVVTSSEDAKKDFQRFYPGSEKKVRVLRFRTYPEKSWFTGDHSSICRKYNLPSKFLLLPNQFFVHKNHRSVFESMKILAAKQIDVKIVCTGNTADWRNPSHFQTLQEYIEREGLNERIRILGLIARDDQIQLMRSAAAIVQPSLFEGWSTVVEDARTLGKKIFLSDIPVHREQAPPRAIYFDPHNATDLANKIADVWTDLTPGPDREAEKMALELQKGLVADYARRFLEIAREAMSLHSKGSV